MRRLIILCALLLSVSVACSDDDPVEPAGSSTTEPTGATGSTTTAVPSTTAAPGSVPTTAVTDDDGELAVTGYETSFGMCGGWCRQAVAIDGVDLVLVATDRMEGREATTSGTLTDQGVQRLTEVAADVVPAALDEVYGCPDCADGGAASLTFSTGGDVVTSTYDFGGPPPELTDADALGAEILEAMRTCTSTGLVTVDNACTPLDP